MRPASRLGLATVVTGVIAGLVACGTPSDVAVERSRDISDQPQPSDPTGPTTDPTGPPTDPTGPTTDPTGPTTDPTGPPTDPTGPTTDPTGPPSDPTTPPSTSPMPDIFEEGPDKPAHAYDSLIVATIADLEHMWSVMYPEIYGEPYKPLEGGVWPVYPDRSDQIPGCGTDESTYPEVQAYAAFYCPFGDFVAYDDGPDGILGQLIEDLDPAILPVVLAHEWGHAIQERNGSFGAGTPTIQTEQQADCFSGAWTARALRGDVPGVEFSDREVQFGMAALISVRDPIDTSPNERNAHGSGFDRVGAFQVGFLNGFRRCSELIDNPLPLVPNEFAANSPDRNPNAPFEDEGPTGETGIFTLVKDDLNRYWPLVFQSTETPFPELALQVAADPGSVGCEDLDSVDDGAGYCAADNTVYYDESFMRELYDQFGDFAVGYVLATAWSDGAQDLLGSPFTDEARALLNDCLTGSWVSNILPDADGEVPEGTTAQIEPGDLDEAIQTALLIGDETSDDNRVGTAFEKIDSFRDGALNGLEACSERIPD